MSEPISTPRTDAALETFESSSATYTTIKDVLEAYDFARQLERELWEEKKWKQEDPRMLREQIRVADVAYQQLLSERDELKKRTEELNDEVSRLCRELDSYL